MPSIANLVRSDGDPRIIETGRSSLYAEDRLAKSLGWFSVGLGLAEIFAARRLTRLLGLYGKEPLVRMLGAREVASGVTTLSTEKESGLWLRLAGDLIDLSVLAGGLSPYNPQRRNVKFAMAAVAGVTTLDALAAAAVRARKRRSSAPATYADRSGFPKGLKKVSGQPMSASRKFSAAR